jgi:hypothetical protein
MLENPIIMSSIHSAPAGRYLPLAIFLVVSQYLMHPTVNSFVLQTTPHFSSLMHRMESRKAASLRDDSGDSAALSAFADSLDRPDAARSNTVRRSSSTYLPLNEQEERSWQASLEKLLDPTTPLQQRQNLLSELLNSNQEIRESVVMALRDRKVCMHGAVMDRIE